MGTARNEIRRPIVLPRSEPMEQGSPPDQMELDRPYPSSPRTDRWRADLDKYAPLPTYTMDPIRSPSPQFIPDEYNQAEAFSPEPEASRVPVTTLARNEPLFNYNQMVFSPISPASIADNSVSPPAVPATSKQPAPVPQPLVVEPAPPAYQLGASAQFIYNDAIYRPESTVIGARAGVTLRTRDLLTLDGIVWLNDNIINYYFSMLVSKAWHTNAISVFAFTTFFYSSLSSGTMGPRTWTSGIDIFNKDNVLIPVHAGLHWCLAVFNVGSHSLNVYDSIPSPQRKSDILQRVRKYIRDEHRSKRGVPYPYGLDEGQSPVVPPQNNGHDCGVFVCQYAKAVVQGMGFNFCSKDMPVIRRTMIWEIVVGSISWDHVNSDLVNYG